MRTMTKKAALLSAALAVTLLSGCACNDRLDALEARVGTVEKTANDALAAANRAQSTADGAAAAAADAQQTTQWKPSAAWLRSAAASDLSRVDRPGPDLASLPRAHRPYGGVRGAVSFPGCVDSLVVR